MTKEIEKLSKFLSYILRHNPEEISLTLDSEGWANISTLLLQANKNGTKINKDLLLKIVRTNDKKRFSISEDSLKIRAVQGHSSKQVKIKYLEQTPPEFLYHGTATRFIESIKQQGLIAVSRHYVHLSLNEQTALNIGQRHGKPVVIKIKSTEMFHAHFKFYLAENGVWLTENVPVSYLIF